MLAALAERGIVPDVLVGTSVGALNAAYIAGHGPSAEAVNELIRLWLWVRRRDVSLSTRSGRCSPWPADDPR